MLTNSDSVRVSLVDTGSINYSTQKEIARRTKMIEQKVTIVVKEQIEKLHECLKKKDKIKAVKSKELSNWESEINPTALFISRLCLQVYNKFPYGGRENHYQALLEAELQQKGFIVRQEVAVTYKVNTTSGEVLQLPHGIHGREDLLLPQKKMILELKQVNEIGDIDHQQLLRYMHQRHTFSEWGTDTTGMLINFGKKDLEIWFVNYTENDDTNHIRLMKIPKVTHKSWEVNAYKMSI